MTVRTISPITLADAITPGATLSGTLAQITGMSLFIALCAQVSIPLPFTPVPLTGSTLGVLYAGALLGSRRGPAAVLLYLLEGSLGLPFFAGGAAGFVHLAGPTGGYLLGFIAGAWVTGCLAERGWDRKPFTAMAMMLLGSVPVFALGLLGLARFIPSASLLPQGLYPFIPGDIAKACASAALLPLGWRWINGRGKS